ncbi:hypothetical protein AB4125_00365 [Vibrio splendidus]
MKNTIKLLAIACVLLTPMLVAAAEHNHSHNHFNPELEKLGDDIIGLTVCYKNGHLSDENQEPAFMNLINHANVEGEDLGMYYMDKLGPKAEQIMSDDDARRLWTQDYCADLTDTYLDSDKLAQRSNEHQSHSHGHDHGHHHNHHNHDHHGHGDLTPEVLEQDIERGRLLSIN